MKLYGYRCIYISGNTWVTDVFYYAFPYYKADEYTLSSDWRFKRISGSREELVPDFSYMELTK